jgi:hypothetical protein
LALQMLVLMGVGVATNGPAHRSCSRCPTWFNSCPGGTIQPRAQRF